MKKISLFFTLLCCAFFSFGQNYKDIHLIDIDSLWGKEIFRFPARNMDYKGVGEVRFPPKGWRTQEHINFWTYTFAWDINLNTKITEKELEINLVKYFNSLNTIEMKATTDNRFSSAKVIQTKQEKVTAFFKGSLRIFDRFTTKKMIPLNVLIESHYCKKKKRTILLFKFSPKEFGHEVWTTTLKKIKLHTLICDY